MFRHSKTYWIFEYEEYWIQPGPQKLITWTECEYLQWANSLHDRYHQIRWKTRKHKLLPPACFLCQVSQKIKYKI